jgi:hypothetical protein
MSKSIIYYHRAYRKITGSGWLFLFELAIVSLPLSLFILFIYPSITEQMSRITQAVLSSYYIPDSIKVIGQSFILGDVSLVSIRGTHPSALTSFVNFIISLALIVFLPYAKRGKNIAIFIIFLAAINLVSALFFTLIPLEFPYSGTDFSELYVKTEISMWLFIPFILGMALLPLPAPILPKFLLIVLALIYSVIFGTLRYIIFLFIISKFSVIYMALLFFAFGPLIDFVYIVGIYCFYTSKLAKNLKGSENVWKWLY